jgi:hypothetical protein
LPLFEKSHADDRRPHAAVEAAWTFVDGANRTKLQRIAALDAHRGAKDATTEAAKHAADAAGDAAAAAYRHPLAKATQVGHILSAAAHAARAAELSADGDPRVGNQRIAQTTLTGMSRIFTTSFASVYPHYVTKVEKKGRTKAELDQVIEWLTGFDESTLSDHLAAGTTFEGFFTVARLNPHVSLITGVVCGVRVEDVDDPLMRKIRYLDKLVDELAKGKSMDRILRA